MKTSKQNQVGNFEKLVSFTTAQGAVYNPGRVSIKNAALQTMLTQAQGSIQAAYVSQTAYTNALNARKQGLDTLYKMATRIMGALASSGVSEETLESCKAIKRRFHRPRVRMPLELGATPATASSRATSYSDIDSVIATFEELVVMATSDPLYKPNEAELQSKGLTTFINDFRQKQKAVIATRVAMLDARRRMKSICFGKEGIYGHAVAVKAYIKSVFGYTSSQYKAITDLNFVGRK